MGFFSGLKTLGGVVKMVKNEIKNADYTEEYDIAEKYLEKYKNNPDPDFKKEIDEATGVLAKVKGYENELAQTDNAKQQKSIQSKMKTEQGNLEIAYIQLASAFYDKYKDRLDECDPIFVDSINKITAKAAEAEKRTKETLGKLGMDTESEE